MRRLITFFIAAALAIPANASIAATCGYWVPQTNGSLWRICYAPSNGERFCELKWPGTIKRITCP